MPNPKSWSIPLVLFLFSFILRFSLISKGPYDIDCLELALQSEEALRTLSLPYLHGAGYPLNVILGAVFIFLGRLFFISDPVICVNFMSVVLSSFCIVFQYLLTKRFFDETAAILSAFMLSIAPVFLGLSVYGANQIPFMLFLLGGLNLLVAYTQNGLKKYLWGSAIVFGLMTACREHDTILMSVALSFLFFFGTDKIKTNSIKERMPLFVSFWLIIIFIAFIFHLPFLMHSHNAPFFSQFGKYVSDGLWRNFLGLFSSRLKIAFMYLVESLTWIGLLIALLGLTSQYQKRRALFFFFVLWIGVSFLFYGNLHTTVTARYFIMILPAFIMAQSYVFSQFMQRNKPLQLLSLLLFLGIFFALFMKMYPLLSLRHERALLPEFARWVKENTEPNAQIIVADERLFIEYYAKRQTFGRPMSIYGSSAAELEEFKIRLDQALAENIPVYITAAGMLAYNKNAHFTNFLREYYRAEFIGENLYEDWHWGATYQQVFPIALTRIWPK